MGIMRFGSLFAGIGGFDLGFERAGMECAWQVEIDDYCNRVLEKHWPDVRRYRDVKEVHGVLAHTKSKPRWNIRENAGNGKRRESGGKSGQSCIDTRIPGRTTCPSCLPPVDLICGGFPCQPHSVAGKRRGAKDDRDLWPEYRRIIEEVRPRWVVGENVPGIRTTILDQVLSDLEGIGYTAETISVPACAFDAPHRRERYFIVAYAEQERCRYRGNNKRQDQIHPQGEYNEEIVQHGKGLRYKPGEAGTDVADTSQQFGNGGNNHGRSKHRSIPKLGNCGEETRSLSSRWTVEPGVGRVANGVPNRVDRLRALGNAVVPQVAEFIGRMIMEVDQEITGGNE
jgi:DNA (cytosine-5)-methyltransferase 1